MARTITSLYKIISQLDVGSMGAISHVYARDDTLRITLIILLKTYPVDPFDTS